MHELLAFLQENPILSLILASMILGTLVKLAPWRRGGGDE